jgi:multicopper oxidase
MVSRRGLLVGGAAAGLLAACNRADAKEFVAVDGAEVSTAEAARHGGPVVPLQLRATAGQVDLGGVAVETWSYGGRIPGAPLRVTAGQQVNATVANGLPAQTSVHWHGVALRNDADGVPHVTQAPIAPGGEYAYRFTAAHPGTYWLHPHAGTQLDRGLYALFIVDDPREPLSYDDEWVVVLDDWLDGVAGNPDDTLARLRRGMMHGGMHAMATSVLLGGDAGDVTYPHYLLNGRVATNPEVYQAKPGTRVRIRIVNAGGDTAFRVALGGHTMTVTHTDGFAVRPRETDALLIGMGERYDVLVTLGAGVFPLVALAEGKNANALGLVRTGGGDPPPTSIRPTELDRRIATYQQLKANEATALTPGQPARSIRLELTGSMMGYDWGFNGHRFDHAKPAATPLPCPKANASGSIS